MIKKKKTSKDLTKQLKEQEARLLYDTEAKNLFGLKEVMGYILTFVVPEFQGIHPEVAASFILEVHISKDEVSEHYGNGAFRIKEAFQRQKTTGAYQRLNAESKVVKEKTIFFDIKVLVKNPQYESESTKTLALILNLEMQREGEEQKLGYPIEKRGVYYLARLISEQLGVLSETTDYNDLNKVYGIWIIPEQQENRIDSYRFVNQKGETNHKADLLELHMIWLSKRAYKGEYGLFDYLHALLDKMPMQEKEVRLEKYFDLDTNQEMKEGINTMCNLSEGIYQDGIHVGKELGIDIGKEMGIGIGKEMGITIGKKQGEELGMQRGKLLSAKIMLESGMELSYIAKKLELSEELITEYIKNESNQ